MSIKPLNIFYQEPDPDRWIKYDRYPRRLIRRLYRGKQKAGGVQMVATGLMKGLDKLNVPYRFNDLKYIRNHPDEIACIIGKPQLLFEGNWKDPVIFGAAVYSHPIECPDLFDKYPNVKRFLVPGEWMREMYQPWYGNKVVAWPVGIDTDDWKPFATEKNIDFLIYDKVRWEHDHYDEVLIRPIINTLRSQGLTCQTIRYGHYGHEELKEKLAVSKAVIFLCEHETQGQAYQQILATGTPIFAWDRGGYWQDPYYYPEKVKFEPVSSVPYWDERCGLKFKDATEFEKRLDEFLSKLPQFRPRSYIEENLSLTVCAQKYLDIYHDVEKEIGLRA